MSETNEHVEYHTFSTLERRFGGLVGRSTLYGWIEQKKLKPIGLSRTSRQMAFWKTDLDKVGTFLIFQQVKRLERCVELKVIRKAVDNPATANDRALVMAYFKTKGHDAGRLYAELSRRWKNGNSEIGNIMAQTMAKNRELAAKAPEYHAFWSKAGNKTELRRTK